MNRLRRGFIVLFCGFHFLSVAWWAFPNSYADFVLEQVPDSSLPARLERKLFQWHQATKHSPLFQLSAGYIDLIGAYQYWDFFAPVSPRTIHYLSVCNDIAWQPSRRRIDCAGNVLYKSYDGSLVDALGSFDGARSRSFRFAENFVGFDSDTHDQFNAFWAERTRAEEAPDTVYLIDHRFRIQTDHRGIPVARVRADNFLSVLNFPRLNGDD